MSDSIKKDYWNDRWITNRKGWDIGYPSPSIIAYMNKFVNKEARILIPGCGNAYEASALISSGFKRITLIDIAEKAVEILREKFKDNQEVEIICGDFFELNATFDVIIEQTFFCAIDPALRPQYVLKTAELLRDKGKLIGLLFDIEFEKIRPPFGGTASEYQTLFEPLFNLLQLTACKDSIPERQGAELFIEFEKK